MYTTKQDFNSTKPNPRIAEVTNVSDGTLSKICKESSLSKLAEYQFKIYDLMLDDEDGLMK